ncbi:MAG: hypothetical protein DI586_03555 [Micavibrio aeruginosavorus]|uniref:AAA+ ATPase domain-containing protein n=1 Tax=Micavibrio aeruginosavorus TaxID=349221 RepID=A0A2W5HS19_9BACT|nr:MAG: hypothetical protein DI586_03555 [Micavibrio aeruginosavorus]
MLNELNDVVEISTVDFNVAAPRNKLDTFPLPTLEIGKVLNWIDPSSNYKDWLETGMALHAGGYPVEVWDTWSKRSDKYVEGETLQKWQSFTSDHGITMGTLIFKARKAGCPKSDLILSSIKDSCELTLFTWEELINRPKKKSLVKGLIDENSFVLLYGASNTGKSFVALDIALAITVGKQWCSRKVEQGKAVYVAAEGGSGLIDRLTAYRSHHGLVKLPPISFLTVGIDMCQDQNETKALIKKINEIGEVRFIILDTLSRLLAGGNENSPDAMGAFIKNCDLIREATGATVMAIHHTGKDDGRGARGHSSLRAAADTEIEVKKAKGTQQITVEVTKQRDYETGQKMTFDLQSIEVGKDEDGFPIYSCIVAPNNENRKQTKELTPQQRLAFEILKITIEKNGVIQPEAGGNQKVLSTSECKDALIRGNITKAAKPGDAKSRATAIIKELVLLERIECAAEFVWISDKPDILG